ncbi:hypothetical protein Z517_05391 [Fonsecaea pedrosoi CBS 271.37]|uniref:Metallo-beta-lactamase domain-containing protein n=1 Tax=Fonsecaea pedrosoi CBS 271.37 TaxID=1442368 RepID=A0A0D2HCY3_9EURO|nr:uncharacterized protein Z517_05391 [Fonsecaea pedrosoi CBS 271.37]KIW82364.1 hypothetical protein Z517_05391 [Fonsecaea pedrosoi CBS 271.37]
MENSLVELDSIAITAIVNDEIDLISPSRHPDVHHPGCFTGVPLVSHQGEQEWTHSRGGASVEMRMDRICCGAHGLCLLVSATKGEETHTLMFDAGPEAEAFERNVRRLGLIDGSGGDIGTVETILLSHWHRDHSGGLLKAIEMINRQRTTQAQRNSAGSELAVDIPPERPLYRGIAHPAGPICLEADPSPEEIAGAGACVVERAATETILGGFFGVTGMIPRKTTYETGIAGGLRFEKAHGCEQGTWLKDEEIQEERVVVCRLKGKGLVVFTGCSHAGIINIANHVLDTFSTASRRQHDFYALVGGYHLADASESRLQSTLTDLTDLGPKLLMPGHCTGWRFRALLEQRDQGPPSDNSQAGSLEARSLKGRTVPLFAGNRYQLSSV